MIVHPTLTSQMAASQAESIRHSARPSTRRFSRLGSPRREDDGSGRLTLLRRQLLALGLPENDLT